MNIPKGWKLDLVDSPSRYQLTTPCGAMVSFCENGDGGASAAAFDFFNDLMAQPQPAAHLTIPGALEWDGDNGTHGADGESRAHGESEPALAIVDESDDGLFIEILYGEDGSPLRRGDKLYGRPSDRGYVSKLAYEAAQKERDDLRAQLANTEQSRRSFFDLSQDLEKRLAELQRVLGGMLFAYDDGVGRDWSAPLLDHARTLCPAFEFVPAPAKTKTCIECDQPYCHGVCVERGDQDYDREQAAKGGDQ